MAMSRIAVAFVILGLIGVVYSTSQGHFTEQDLQSGFHRERSGDFVVYNPKSTEGTASVSLLTMGQKLSIQARASATALAHALVDLFNLPSTGHHDKNPIADAYRVSGDKASPIKTNVNALFIVRGSEHPRAGKEVAALKNNAGSIQTTGSAPSSPDATIASALTGDKPSRHGIIANQWLDRASRKRVSAFDPKRGMPLSVTIADALEHVYEGRSTIVSYGADPSTTIGIPRPASDSSYLIRYQSGVFAQSNTNRLPIHTVKSTMSDPRIERIGATSSAEGMVTIDGVSFDMKMPVHAEVINTLAGALSLADAIADAKTAFGQRFTDQTPDSILFNLNGCDLFSAGNPRHLAAVKLTINTINAITTGPLSKLPRTVTGQVLWTGANTDAGRAMEGAESIILSSLGDELLDTVSSTDVFPQVYLKPQSSPATFNAVCEKASSLVQDLGLSVYCPAHVAPAAAAATKALIDDSDILAQAGDNTPSSWFGNNNTPPTQDEINEWQISMWTGIIMGLLMIYASYCLCYMHLPKDPMLYTKTKLD